MLQIASKGVRLETDPNVITALQRQFLNNHALLFHQVLECSLMASLQDLMSRSRFEMRQVPDVGNQEIESPTLVGRALGFAFGQQPLISWINEITGGSVSSHVFGGLARFVADSNHRLNWHDDHVDSPIRQLAITINLSSTAYEGGVFELRSKGRKEILFSHHYGGPGSLVLFRVDRRLEHRVTPVESGGPRLVYAGWYA